ncbi:uncharacterized protein LOC143199877 [Rhynchophorus ferrugineus]|uniref:uncharacterized protein LOC143199877 n=1 Tax=Rhynchophorus ferrugineus TaxID=354439 RepID=UPI003FCC6EE9
MSGDLKVEKNDRTPGRGGGTAILVRKGVKHELLPSLSVNNFETTSIKIDIQERPFVITSLYRKSSAFNYAEYRSLVEGKFPKIIGGDFNAHHPTWGCSRANPAGNAIVALSADLGYGLALPDEPTHHPSTVSQGAARILDFFILQDVNRDSERVRAAVSTWRAMKWNSFLADQRLDGPPSFWRVSKCLVGKTHNVIPPLKSAVTGNFAVTDQEKVELLAETYEAQMKCLPPAQNTKTKDIDTVINESNSVKRPVTPAFLLNHFVSPKSLQTMIEDYLQCVEVEDLKLIEQYNPKKSQIKIKETHSNKLMMIKFNFTKIPKKKHGK